MEKKNYWTLTCRYFRDEVGVGSVGRRQHMLRCVIPASYKHDHTIDTYRNVLTQAGYLKRIRLGVYLVVKMIPLDLTYSKARDQAYPDNVSISRSCHSRGEAEET